MTNMRSPRSPVSTRPARRSASPTTTSRARSTRARPSASTGAPPSSSTSTSRSRTYYSSNSSNRWAAAAPSADKRDRLESPRRICGVRERGSRGLICIDHREEAQAWRADTACSMGRVIWCSTSDPRTTFGSPYIRCWRLWGWNHQTVQTPNGVRRRSRLRIVSEHGVQVPLMRCVKL